MRRLARRGAWSFGRRRDGLFRLGVLLVVVGSFLVGTASPAAASQQAESIEIPLTINAMAYDRMRVVIYAAVDESDVEFAQQIVRVDPLTGSLLGGVRVRSNPTVLEVSDDSSYLFVGFDDESLVQRISLATFAVDLDIPLGSDGNGDPYIAADIEAVPGAPTSFAVARKTTTNTSPRGVAVYDGDVKRPVEIISGAAISVGSIVFGPVGVLFGSNIFSTGREFFVMAVDDDGVTETSVHLGLFTQGRSEELIGYAKGRVFTSGGSVLDVTSTPTFEGILNDRFSIRAADYLESSETLFVTGFQRRADENWLPVAEHVPTSRALVTTTEVPSLEGMTSALDLVVVGRGNFAVLLPQGRLHLIRQSGNVSTVSVGLVDPSQGLWHLRDDYGRSRSFFYGNPGDYPFMGDWNCDGTDTPGLYRQSDGYVYLRNSNTQGVADVAFFFGDPGDVPLAGDFNGDGCSTLSIYRPNEARFYIINELGANDGGLGAADYSFLFGNVGDLPVVGDWDGDGIDEVGLYRGASGFFYNRDTLDTGSATQQFYFGDPDDRFVAGDWGIVDGVDTPAVYRPSSSTFFFRYTNTPGNADATLAWGDQSWLPVSGDYALIGS